MKEIIIFVVLIVLYTLSKGIFLDVVRSIIIIAIVAYLAYLFCQKYIFKERNIEIKQKPVEIFSRNSDTTFNKTKLKISAKKNNALLQNKAYRKIKASDVTFDGYNFLAWFKNIFLKYQQALEDNDINSIKKISTKEFGEKQEAELKKTEFHQMNKKKLKEIRFGKILAANIASYEQTRDKESIIVCVKYTEIMDEYNQKTIEKIKGLSDRETQRQIYVMLERTVVNTENNKIKNTNCPHCGAPTEIISTGKCSYCGNIIQIKKQEWKIADVWTYLEAEKRREEIERLHELKEE